VFVLSLRISSARLRAPALAVRSLVRHRIKMRDALIKLFKEPVPESYKAGREVLHNILGSDNIPADRLVLCFSSNPHLSSLAKPGVTPVVWEM
jgi:hypothetical protein